MKLKRPFHISPPDSLEKRDHHSCLCGINDLNRLTFLFLGGFLGSGIVEQEELCEKCYELYMAKQDQTPGKTC
jgi:hypothetical protein